MSIVRVVFEDWNGETHHVNVTSDMCPSVHTSVEEKAIITAIRYLKKRYINCYKILSVFIIAN